ncbi:hypothetical protein ACP179_05235 [Xenorhabdus stockiae]|uniref:hypothetical protein n=1 Tax=Xenorhabdus stockiae TaxID=351614 RepID=UPI003CE84B9D
MLASNLIIPNLSVLQKKYPDLALEIITDSRIVNLHRRDADLALRLVRSEQGHVTFRPVRLEYWVLGYMPVNNTGKIIHLRYMMKSIVMLILLLILLILFVFHLSWD